MVSDLVEELRDRAALIMPDNPSGLLDSAADKIERLDERIAELEETIRQSHRDLIQAGMGDTTTARRLEDALGAIASQTINEKRSADDE